MGDQIWKTDPPISSARWLVIDHEIWLMYQHTDLPPLINSHEPSIHPFLTIIATAYTHH